MTDHAEDAQLLSIAGSISDRQPVNWDTLQESLAPELAPVVDELRLLETVARLGDETPATWGPYAIIAEIGRGSFGTVYRAHDPELQRDVALKVIRPLRADAPFDPDRALDEARRLARVDHDNVVRVYRADRLGNEVGMSMELITGETLDAVVEQRGPLGASEVTLIGIDLCRALAAVHGTETLHGDIKAHNVMRSAGGRVVLTDFGTSKDVSRTRQQLDGDFAGTPLYLAPEVFRGAARTRASDIYSLGVLLFFLASGTYPVNGSTKTEVGRQHDTPGARRLLRDLRPDLPDGFVRVVERALAENPHERYTTAGELEMALRKVVTGNAATPWAGVAIKVMIAVAVVGAALLVRQWMDSSGSPSTIDAADRTATPAPVAAPPGSYDVDAAVYREEKGGSLRLEPGARLAVGDELSLRLHTSVPAYVYVVNEDEKGKSYLLFPVPGITEANPLPAGDHRLPRTGQDQRYSWRVTTRGSRDHLFVFVSPEHRAALEEMFKSLPPPALGDGPGIALPVSAVARLRGIGGISSTSTVKDPRIRDVPAYSTPLTPARETVQGLWVRQITFETP